MMDSPIDEIKERLDIIDIISTYIKLEKTGANHRALCPFHSDKKPSLFVSPSRQIWKCFGCGAAGDIFAFIQQIEGVEFGDALRILAKRAGVELRKQNPEIQTARKRFYDICEWGTKFFEKQIQTGQLGGKAKEYLFKRGLLEDSIEKWRIGFAPDTWNALLNFLREKGFSVGEIERTGLVLINKEGKSYDRFRGRIIFPIFDLNSQVIGFGGRAFVKPKREAEGMMAKYLNIPNTLLYNKSQVLYGLNRAKVPIRKEDACILVEGYTDVIMSWQAGVENVVATSGTALTAHQLSVLKRYSKNLIISFDMDVAGDSATKRGIDLAQTQGFSIKVADLPKGKDPADVVFIKIEDWKKVIEKSKSILDFYFENAFSIFDSKTPEGKRNTSAMLLPIIKRIHNKIEQSSWIKELARRLEVSEESVEQELKRCPSVKTRESLVQDPCITPQKTRRGVIEEKIISLLLNYSKGIEPLKEDSFKYFSAEVKEVLEKIQQKPKDLLKSLKGFDFSKEQQESLNYLALRGEIEIDLKGEEVNIEKEILTSFNELKFFAIKEKLMSLSKKIKQVEQNGKKEEVESLSKEFSRLVEELDQNNNQPLNIK